MANSRWQHGDGLPAARILMVLSSLSPLFILWAIRGSSVVPNGIFTSVCLLLALLPTALLFLRIWIARKRKDLYQIVVGRAEDHRSHVITYLFATLLPFYRDDLAGCRDLVAMTVALLFIVVLFWRLNLHYTNAIFAIRGYRVFTVFSPDDGNVFTGREPLVVITHRHALRSNDTFGAYRLSDTVYLEDRK